MLTVRVLSRLLGIFLLNVLHLLITFNLLRYLWKVIVGGVRVRRVLWNRRTSYWLRAFLDLSL